MALGIPGNAQAMCLPTGVREQSQRATSQNSFINWIGKKKRTFNSPFKFI